MMSLATVVMMVEPPGEPRTRRRLPRRYQWLRVVMMVGVMAESGRLPGAMELAELWMRPNMLGTPIFEVKSSISLFMRKPRPSMRTPEPKPPLRVVVLETALPSESTMEKWVVSVDSFVVVAEGGGA